MVQDAANNSGEKAPRSVERARRRTKKETKENLSPLAYAVAYQETAGKLKEVESQAIFNAKMQKYQDIVQAKARRSFLASGQKSVENWWKEQGQTFKEALGKDPRAEMAWNDLLAFEKTHVTASGVVLAANFLGAGMDTATYNAGESRTDYLANKRKLDALENELQALRSSKKSHRGDRDTLKGIEEKIITKKAEIKNLKSSSSWTARNLPNLAGKTLAVVKPVIITNMILQPGVIAGANVLLRNVGTAAVKGVQVTKNVIYGAVSGDLVKEVVNIGRGGNPVTYLWSGKNLARRNAEKLKDANLLNTPDKFLPYADRQIQSVYKAINMYKQKPEMLEKKIPKAAEIVYRTALCDMTPEKIKLYVARLDAGKWDAVQVRRLMAMSISGGILKFFSEKASPEHRAQFVAKLKKYANLKHPLRSYNRKDLLAKFPGVNKKLTKKEKTGLRAALDLGATGLVASAFITGAIASKAIFTLGAPVSDVFDRNEGGWDRIGGRFEKFTKKQNQKIRFTSTLKAKQTEVFLNGGRRKFDKMVKNLSGKQGILTEKEAQFLSTKLTGVQKEDISKDLIAFKETNKRWPEVREFWLLKNVKKLRKLNFREKS